MSCNVIPFKRGGTFIETCSTSQPINGWGIASQIRRQNGDLVAELVVNIMQSTPTGIFTLTCAGSTAGWPLETLVSDIVYTPPDRELATETFYIDVMELISR